AHRRPATAPNRRPSSAVMTNVRRVISVRSVADHAAEGGLAGCGPVEKGRAEAARALLARRSTISSTEWSERSERMRSRHQLAAAKDRAGRDVLLLSGPEPDYQWRGFAREVRSLGTDLGVRLMVGLNSFASPIPHSRPVRLVASATSTELAREVGFIPGEQE